MKKTQEFFFRSCFGRFNLEFLHEIPEGLVKAEIVRGFSEGRCFAFTIDPHLVSLLRTSVPLSSIYEEIVRIKNTMTDQTAGDNTTLKNRLAHNIRLGNLLISTISLLHRAVAEIPANGLTSRRFVLYRENRGSLGILPPTAEAMVLAHVGQGPEWKEIPTVYLSLKLFAALDASLLRGETEYFTAFKDLLVLEERAIETGYSHTERVPDELLGGLTNLVDEVVRISTVAEARLLEPEVLKPVKRFTSRDRQNLSRRLDARLQDNILNFDYRENADALDTITRLARRYRKAGDLNSLKEIVRLLVAASGHDIHEIRNKANILLERIFSPKEFDAPLSSRFINTAVGEEIDVEFHISNTRENYFVRVYSSGETAPINLEDHLQFEDVPLRYDEETKTHVFTFCGNRPGHVDFLVFRKKGSGSEWIDEAECSGRINIIPDIRGEIILEIFPDIHGHTRLYWEDPDGHTGLVYDENGEVIRTGTFSDIIAHLEDMKERYLITALYILGIQRRGTNREDWAPEARSASPFSPMSLIDIEPSLGGEDDFRALVGKAHELGIKIIVDVIPHVNRKSTALPDECVIRTYDEDGRLVERGSTDGRYGSWNDGKLLNYRMLAVWEWLTESVLTLIDRFDIDGIRFDSAHAVPVMMKRNNFPEIYGDRRSHEEMLEGTIIVNDREDDHFITTGYYDSSCCEYIANPFHYYLMLAIEKKLKEKGKPFFIHLAECFWGREQYLSRTGIVAYNSALFKICEHIIHGRTNVREIYHLYKSYYPMVLPRGTELAGILGNHDERRALNTFGPRGLKAAVGLTSFLSDLLMDYEGGAEGEGWKIYLDNIYVNWNQFEAAADRGLKGFYRKIYEFHRQYRGKSYLIETDNAIVAAAVKYTGEDIWIGAFNFSDVNQFARLSFDDPSLPINPDAWYRCWDPSYSAVDARCEYFTGRELRVTKMGVIIPFTDRMKLLRLDELEKDEENHRNLLLDSMLRIPTRTRHSFFTGTYAFEELGKHLSSNEDFEGFLETVILPLFIEKAEYDLPFILKRLLYHIFRYSPQEGRDILARVTYLTESDNTAIRNIGTELADHFRNGPLVFIAAEAEPFSKSGGLANVVFELPKKLAEMGEETYVIIPLYRNGSRQAMAKQQRAVEKYGITYTGTNVKFMIHDVEYTVGVHSGDVNGVRYFLLEHHEFFDGLYWGYTGWEKLRRRVAFCRACAEVITTFRLKPFFVFSNEAYTGLFNGIVRSDRFYSSHPDFLKTHFLFVIHNGGWQYFDSFHRFENGADLYSLFNLSSTHVDRFLDPYHPERLNLMAAGIRFSDRVMTVSPSYARQIESACDGLEYLLHDVIGISNAIDEGFFHRVEEAVKEARFIESNLEPLLRRVESNPELQRKLKERYPEILESLKNPGVLKSITPKWKKDYIIRLRNKLLLQSAYDLDVDPDRILFTMIHRITDQKGFSLLLEASKGLFTTLGFQGIVGGQVAAGDTRGEELASGLHALAGYYRGTISVTTDFIDVRVPLYASDIFLMPSLNEPGGISQLEALSCGCLVVARATGGLRDTVHPISQKNGKYFGNGFLFSDYSASAFYDAMNRCRNFFISSSEQDIQNAREWARNSVFTWDRPAAEYIERLYELKEVIRPTAPQSV